MDGSDHSERLRQIESAVAALEDRVRALEGGVLPAPVSTPHVAAPVPHAALDLTGSVALLGRTVLIFGGAYFLRALTESGRVPAAAGVFIGLAYALTWLVAAARATPAKRQSAQFHGVTSALLALPIIWEATVRFSLFPAPVAALLLGGSAALALVIASRQSLQGLAGSAAFGTVIAALAIGYSLDNYGPFAIVLVALSAATYWYAERPRHSWLRWPVGVMAGVSVAMVTARAASQPPHELAAVALVAQALLVLSMQASLAVRTVLLSRNVRLFDVLQGFFSLAIGVGGAALLVHHSAPALMLVGAITAILGSGAYIAAFFRLADRPHLGASYHAFAAFGLVAATMGLVLIFSGHALAIAALILALVTLAIGQERLGGYAPLHAAAFLVTSVIASELLTEALSVWTSQPVPWPSMDLVAWLTLAAAGAAALMPAAARTGIGGALTLAGQLVMASVFVIGAGGAAVMLLAPIVAADAGTLASLRTVLLSLAVFCLAMSARSSRTAVFARLVYPALIVGGLKLIVDDFRHSRPSTLFVALAFYGLALVIAGRARTAASRNGREGN